MDNFTSVIKDIDLTKDMKSVESNLLQEEKEESITINIYEDIHSLNHINKNVSLDQDSPNIKTIVNNLKNEINKLETSNTYKKLKENNCYEQQSFSIRENSSEKKRDSVSFNSNKQDDNDILMWTSSIEDEITNFANICEADASEFKKKSKSQSNIGKSLQISLIILGSLSVYSSASNIDLDIKNSISLITGFSTTVISSIYTMFGFTKKSTITLETSLGLDSIARMIRCELLKPKNKRISPFDLIYYANITRDKIIKKKGDY